MPGGKNKVVRRENKEMEENKMAKVRRTGAARRAIAGVMAMGLLAGGALTAYAAENTGSMTVQYTKEDVSTSTFTLNIPKSVTLSETAEVSENVGLSAIDVKDTEKVEIKVASGITNGKVELTEASDANNAIHSTVSLTSGGAGIADNAVVAAFSNNTITPDADTGTLYFSAIEENVNPGTYSGIITFTASIENK